ncbi:NTF2-like N-terminal transpeptidase domain-containing protein [Tsukamurella sp. PLM1]|uniref:NTF2-like N-terminal transpeptidase domain-containing protein n=1 Tax=Tsukamurella sp. PLM1 TaxID=2929795 RepID=UPI0020BF9EF8|nr:NTF2-like N-terminal transpeptidase domain-containing protein [Tsukamurella sp. PLM1]
MGGDVRRSGRARLGVTALASALLLAVGSSLAACGDDATADVQKMLAGYAEAIEDGKAVAAAAYTSSPDAAGGVIGRTLRDMNAKKVEVSASNVQKYSGGNATFDVKTKWNFGDGRDWDYTTKGSASQLSIGWRISWDPAVLAPGLTPETSIRQIRTDARPPKVFAADKSDLMFAGTVHRLTVDPAKTKNLGDSLARVAQIVSPVAPLVTAESLEAKAKADPGKPVPVVDLRDDDFGVLEDDLEAVPGLQDSPTGDLLISNRQLFSPLFDGIKGAWQANRDATAGWEVQLVSGDKPTKIVGYQGPPGPDLRTSMDPKVQLQAENAVVQLGQPAAMVVLSVSSGAVLAAAQNTQASRIATDWALTGLSTTGPVLAPVYSEVNAAAGKDADKQKKLLAPLGMGTDFAMTGVKTVTAELPGTGGREAAELGADTVKASPFGMAVFAAAIAKGKTTAPYVVQGQTASPSAPLGDVDEKIRNAVRAKMDSTVSPSGDGSDLVSTKVKGLVGTNGPEGPGWFIGYQGDQAFAIMVTGERSGSGSLQVAGAYLK